MIISRDKIKAAMDEWIAENSPPPDFYPGGYYYELYPDQTRQKIVFMLMQMVEDGSAIKSKKKYIYKETSEMVWYYKIAV